METISNRDAGAVVLGLIRTIRQNKDFLSEVDGKIGDGDHGINMNKGFSMCADKLSGREFSLSEGLRALSETLQEDIGGSMGPLYGVFFEEMSDAAEEEIDQEVFDRMLEHAINGVQEIGNAKKGDKTLLDTLIPAQEAYRRALKNGLGFAGALRELKKGASEGWKSTEDMVAKIGRASRLGERSRGVLDAGATSSYLILTSMADSLLELFS